MSGWIKLKRTIFDHWIASDNEYLSVWIRMLSEANFEDKTKLFNGSLITVKRGQIVFGLQAWSEKTGVQISKLRRLISMLESDSMISRQIFNKYSLISIVNYDFHQADDRQDNSQKTVKPQADDRQTTTPKELKNIRSKEIKDIVDSGESPEPKVKESLFKPPTVLEVDLYMQEIQWGSIEKAKEFVNHYEANNWFRGKTKMKNWKAAVRVWQNKDSVTASVNKSKFDLSGLNYESGDL